MSNRVKLDPCNQRKKKGAFMLADPQSIIINAVATSLPKTQAGLNQSGYVSADGNTSLTTKQNVTASRFRREVRISQKKVSADPISTLSSEKGVSVYLVIDEPKYGFTDVEIGYLVQGLKDWLTNANRDKLLGGEY